MSTTARKQRASSTRAGQESALVAAATEVFAEHGFGGATTAAIASRAGVPKSNLHYYFSTKEALYRAVLASVLGAWLEASDWFEPGATPRQVLARYIEAKMDLARRDPLGSRVFALEIMRGAPLVHDTLETTLATWLAAREAVIERWIASGLLRPVTPRTLIFLIWAATQHYADFGPQISALNGGAPLSDRAFGAAKAEVVALVLDGVAPPDDRAPVTRRAGRGTDTSLSHPA